MMLSKYYKLEVFFIAVIVVFSFCIFGAPYSHFFNRDQAVHVLMVNSFRFPEDLYYWGQNRLGSIIPMLAIPFYKIGIHPLWATALSQYLLLCAGYFFFAKTFSKSAIRIAFALLWFVPITYFTTHTSIAHPYIGQMFFSSLVYYSLFNILNNKWDFHKTNTLVWIAISGFSIGGAIWSSDLSIVMLLAILGIIGIILIKKFKIQELLGYLIAKLEGENELDFKLSHQKEILNKLILILKWMAGPFLISLILIFVAKKYAQGEDYGAILSNKQEFGHTLKTIGTGVFNSLTFQSDHTDSTIVIYALLIVTTIVIFRRIKNKQKLNYIEIFVLVNIIGTFLVCASSRWVYSWDIPSRYFVPCYIWFLVFLCLTVDRLSLFDKKSKYNLLFASLTVLFLGFKYFMIFLNTPTVYDGVKNFSQFGKATFVGGDWYDNHLIVMSNPQNLYSIPFQNGLVRNRHQVDEAFKSEKIYILSSEHGENIDSNFFATTFPQFGYILEKKGKIFKFNNYYYLCEYKLIGKQKDIEYNARQINFNNANIVVDTLGNPKFSLKTESKKDGSAFCFGPYLPLLKGKYEANFYLRKLDDVTDDDIVVTLHVNSAPGVTLASYDVKSKEIPKDKYVKISLSFEVSDESAKNEFLVIDRGRTILMCNKIVLEKR